MASDKILTMERRFLITLKTRQQYQPFDRNESNVQILMNAGVPTVLLSL